MAGSLAVVFRNYAAEVAEPLESGLIDSGAKKVCSTGDNGKGLSNRNPWYNVKFETNLNKEKAIETIREVAQANGYSLQEIFAPNGENVIYKASRGVDYPGLEPGNSDVQFQIYDASDSVGCVFGDPKLNYADDRVVISLNVGLPRFTCGAPLTCNTLPW